MQTGGMYMTLVACTHDRCHPAGMYMSQGDHRPDVPDMRGISRTSQGYGELTHVFDSAFKVVLTAGIGHAVQCTW
jgi:hypothetical protein